MGCSPSHHEPLENPGTLIFAGRANVGKVLPLNSDVAASVSPTGAANLAIFESSSKVVGTGEISGKKLENQEVDKLSVSKSEDSGFNEFEGKYAFVITENSSIDQVSLVEKEFQEKQSSNTENLEIVGVKVSRKLSPKEKEQFEEQKIIEKLRDEGLVFRPESKATGGLKFELVESGQNAIVRRLPPMRLQIREQEWSRRQSLTREQIEERLEKAEERKKQYAEERLARLNTTDRITIAEEAVQNQVEEVKTKHQDKMENSNKNRKKFLDRLQSKLKARKEHAEMVRMRKTMIAVATMAGNGS